MPKRPNSHLLILPLMKARIVSFDARNAPKIIAIRTAVFVIEQKIDIAEDFDGLDETADHVLVYDNTQQPVGTGRLLADGHIGRLAVLQSSRKQGAGREALDALVHLAQQRGLKRIFLGAQLHALEFYQKAGFRRCSDVFEEVGIPHVEMERTL